MSQLKAVCNYFEERKNITRMTRYSFTARPTFKDYAYLNILQTSS